MDQRHIEKLDEIWSHLGADDPVATLVLKGHLLVERELNEYISRCIKHPEYLQGARLTFSQKIAVSRALHTGRDDPAPWAALHALNALRNNLAHSIASSRRSEKIQEFATALSVLHPQKQAFLDSKSNSLRMLRRGMTFLLGFITGLLEPGDAEQKK